jgi:hypothetical protein
VRIPIGTILKQSVPAGAFQAEAGSFVRPHGPRVEYKNLQLYPVQIEGVKGKSVAYFSRL